MPAHSRRARHFRRPSGRTAMPPRKLVVKKTLILLALAAAPFAASACDSSTPCQSNKLGYTYVQLDAVYADAEGVYPWGARLSGSYAFTDNVFATASFGRVKDDDVNGYADYTNKTWSLGVGFNNAIGANADWVSQLQYVRTHAKEDWNGGYWRSRSSGYNISTGVLGHVTDKLTANAYLGYEDYDHHYDGDFYADFGMGYAINKTWSLQGGLKLNEFVETYSLGVRASF